MKRARDIRDQLEGLLERVEIELTSNLNDLDAIKKTIISGKWNNKLSLSVSNLKSVNPSFSLLHD